MMTMMVTAIEIQFFLSLSISLHELWTNIDAATQQRELQDQHSGRTSIEFQTLNAFVGLLPQSSVKLELLHAWKSITTYHHGKSDAPPERSQLPDLRSEDSGSTPEKSPHSH